VFPNAEDSGGVALCGCPQDSLNTDEVLWVVSFMGRRRMYNLTLCGSLMRVPSLSELISDVRWYYDESGSL
jgi:hypothetical protein